MTEVNLKGKTILIVDDVDDNLALFSFFLENTQAKLLFAKNGREAVELCRSDSDIHLVLMDIQMPVLNGLDATSEIRKFNQQLPIIAVTAYAFPGDKQHCIDAGCNDFLSKPIDSEALFQMLKSFLVEE
jgi:CheY-like chemotaxis protein